MAAPRPVITGLTLAAVGAVLIAGVGLGLWLQGSTPVPPPAIAAASPQTPPAPAVRDPTSIPALEPDPVPPGTPAAAPVVPEPVTTRARPAPSPAPDQPPPRVAKQLVFPASIQRQSCGGADRALVIAETESATPPRSVVLRARGPGNGALTSATMSRNGDRWYAALGPFRTTGVVTWQITVTDAAGVSAIGPAGSLRVTDCR